MNTRPATVPVPALAAAAALIAGHLDDPDPATREAATEVHSHLLTAIEDALPGR
jgi:hypothetical protein